ncbi:hypothetical protein GSI_07660 [Ganoderma sinense ZZ0214-1]|nr:hypothetical protein GSI_07660 [Ganoderma sinense ZZ0214-1]
MPGSPGFFRNHTQYPAVRSLSIGRCAGPPLLDHLQHLFPSLNDTLLVGGSDSALDTRAHEDIRAANLRAQDGSESPSHVWKKFDRVICTPSVLHLLALRCPIRHLMLDLDYYAREHSLRCAAEALRENPVPRLKLTLRCRRGMFDGVFTPELAARLSRLTLCLVYDNGNNDNQRPGTEDDAADVTQLLWSDLLNTVTSTLRPLHNVTHLRIVVCCKLVKRPAESESESESSGPSSTSARSLLYPYSESFVDAVRGPAFDFEGTAMAAALPSPALQYVFLTTRGALSFQRSAVHERWDVHRAWRVGDGAGRPASGTCGSISTDGMHAYDTDVDPPSGRLQLELVELHSDVAATIAKNEELVLSDADQGLLFPPIGTA